MEMEMGSATLRVPKKVFFSGRWIRLRNQVTVSRFRQFGPNVQPQNSAIKITCTAFALKVFHRALVAPSEGIAISLFGGAIAALQKIVGCWLLEYRTSMVFYIRSA